MAIITSTEVFDFMGTDSDVRTAQATALIDPLIAKVQIEIEETIGRKVEKTLVTAEKFENVFNCVILGDQLFLKGKYRDMYTITDLKEDGVSLVSETDYLFDPRLGTIKRFDQQWSQKKLAIEITGELGLVNPLDTTKTREDVRQIAIEMVAAKSGLWKRVVLTEGGELDTTIMSAPKTTMASLMQFKLREI